ncbi:MAG TPA: nucleotide sugar dehydrogenase [Usitatibacter sp.]|nr:nucleotide sugar dehydrogenase [Usitatibacter sp.]
MTVGTPAPGVGTAHSRRPSREVATLAIGVLGLGYVGLQLAVQFGRRFPTIGMDLSEAKVAAYRRHLDPSGEVEEDELRAATRLQLTTDASALRGADVVIIAVPTPVDDVHLPDFEPLLGACRTVGPHLKRGATVVFESTVYPGATEGVCIPALERASGKRWKRDFFVGYSPERINPGDRRHGLAQVTKVVAGDTPETLARLVAVYASVVEAGVHAASSIRVAEAAKVIENTQRDLNIALMNELALIFHRMDIDTAEVLAAARTKWNFLDFRPGLVGGHCIGVDPYYLTYAAQKVGHHPEVILAGRRINDGMGKYVAEQAVKAMIASGGATRGSRAALLGLTFKENCADIRNSKAIDVVRELQTYGIEVHVHDPRADPREAMHEYGIALRSWSELPAADVLVLAVAHRELISMPLEALLAKARPGACIVDVKSVLDRDEIAKRGYRLWRL